jgi:hypothetical protein
MLGVLFLVFTVGIAAAMARFEERSALLWGAGALVASILMSRFLGWFGAFYPVPVLVGTFVLLWIAKERDDKRNRDRPRGGIVR